MSKKSKTQPVNDAAPPAILRTVVTHTNFTKWQACIYYSAYDETAQILLLLKTKPGNGSDQFQNRPIYFFTAPTKNEIDSKISRSISSLFNFKKPGGSVAVSEEMTVNYKQ